MSIKQIAAPNRSGTKSNTVSVLDTFRREAVSGFTFGNFLSVQSIVLLRCLTRKLFYLSVMSLLLDVASNVKLQFLSQWLEVKTVGSLDTAFCSEKFRKLFLEIISDPLSIFDGCQEHMGDEYAKWLSLRRLKVETLKVVVEKEEILTNYFQSVDLTTISTFNLKSDLILSDFVHSSMSKVVDLEICCVIFHFLLGPNIISQIFFHPSQGHSRL